MLAPRRPTNEQRLNVCFGPPVVGDQLYRLGNVEVQVVLITPHRQLLHLIPDSSAPKISPTTVMS